MDNYLTVRQVQDILKVDRITIYRMLQDGRIKGVKIGQQWRFTRREVERLLNGGTGATDPAQPETDPGFPTHCVQTIQDLFSEVGQISALVVDTQGTPLTQVSRPCSFCQVLQQSPSGLAACQASWQAAARHAVAGGKFAACHAGLQYSAAPVADEGKPLGSFLAGQFYWQAPEPREEAERIRRLAEAHNLPLETLQQAARTIPLIDPDQHARVEAWPASAARAVQSILHERIGFVARLQQIANLTQID